ncbi:MAG: PaaI family thioesterase [Chitinophagaceae bacterium]
MSRDQRTRTYSWSDPMKTAELAATRSGIEFLNGILNGETAPPPIAQTLDFRPLSLEEGIIRFEFIPQEFHFNPIGSVHGGVISTVLDTVMGCAVHSVLPKGTAYTTLELKVNFVKAVTLKAGRMIAEGRLIHSGKTTALVEADLKDEQGRLYAHSVSTCIIFKPAA